MPVAAPPVTPTVGSQQRWAAFAQFVPDWEDFKAKRGNGVCDPLEECRTDPACCDTSSTPVCGNGFCEEGGFLFLVRVTPWKSCVTSVLKPVDDGKHSPLVCE